MLLAAAAGVVTDCGFSADFAGGIDGGVFVGFVGLQNVFFADIISIEDGDEGRGSCGFLDVDTPSCLLTFDQAHGSHYLESEFAGGFDGLNGGGASGADIVDDHHLGCFLTKAFDALPGAVLLLRFADQESAQLAANYRNGNYDGVGSHGEAANGLRFPAALADFVEKNLPGQLRAARIERGGAAVDVVVAAGPGGKLEVSQFERLVGKQAKQFLARGGHGKG